eukprot:GFYU01002952.1.p1 GENE.GFYU01002952.1~~GFYU01002952.1.p1  ORF type:complete len:240 (+),score=43.77 GFYU01002952.1:70-789(+)
MDTNVVLSGILVGVCGIVAMWYVHGRHRRTGGNSTTPSEEPPLPKLGTRVVCISDTHNLHRQMEIPDGDILIHAGDFTLYGKEEHARDFNEWLGTLPHKHKIVVNGNHESNAGWQRQVREILTNATFLKDEGTTVDGVTIHGTNFFWNVNGNNPYYDLIPVGTDIVIAHNPPRGFCDGGDGGCKNLAQHLKRVNPRLLVCGHIHHAHGQQRCGQSLVVNAANAGHSHGVLGHPCEVVEI